MKLQEVRESALALPIGSRRKLAAELISSLSPKEFNSESKWIMEAEARIDAYERGEIETISLDDFIAHVRKTANGNKASQGRSRRV